MPRIDKFKFTILITFVPNLVNSFFLKFKKIIICEFVAKKYKNQLNI